MSDLDTIIEKLNRLQIDQEDREKIVSILRDYQNQYLQIVDGLPDGYSEYDLEGNLVSFNQATMDLVKQPREALLNLPFKSFMDSETAERVYRAHNEVYRTGISKKGIVFDILLSDGTTMTLECSISLKKMDGKIVGFRGIWQDITSRKKTEAELAGHRRRLEAIFSSVKEGIIALDEHGRVINANQAVETLCGLSVANISGKSFLDATTLCNKSCRGVLLETLTNETSVQEYQVRCKRQDRPYQVVVFNSSPLVDTGGKSMGAVLIIRDVTELLGLEKELRGRYMFQNLVGISKRMQEIYDLLENLANLETTVLITGESGTGKELVAKALHYAGERSDRPFIKVNCSALTESLLESELFGHVKGAFTGAIKDRQGRFQMADGGTILLDEIGDISPLIQLKLLRVLQEKEFERVGESTPRKVDVRVIACTNKDLKDMCRLGQFREDLYYRLKVMEVPLPPLRERLEDLPLLMDHFCKSFNGRYKKQIKGVSSTVLSRFMNYAWPGNVRELEHVLEHAFVLCNNSMINMEHLPVEIKNSVHSSDIFYDINKKKSSCVAQDVLTALEKTHWNKTKAAALLGVNRRTIHRKIKKYKLLESGFEKL